ncbi:MAG TPA: HlyD family secretion protein [Kofleriaceae bacterium]|nr:HlyD family secretion protein [Kofleriaceae bacterium]
MGQDAPIAAPPKRRRAPFVAGGLVIAAAAAAAVFYLTRQGKEATDDAQVEAHVSSVSAQVAGQVKRVAASDNQEVKAGDVLVELDDRDQQAKLSAARADLAEANAQLRLAETQLSLTQKTSRANLTVAEGAIAQAAAVTGSTAAQIDQSRADVAAAESHKQLARLERERAERLRAMGAAPQSEIDAKIAADTSADAALAQAQARLASALANRSNSSGTEASARGRLLAAQTIDEQVAASSAQVDLSRSRVEQRQAAVDRAALELEHTKVRAEIAGRITKRSVEPGQLVSPDRMLMAIVDLSDTWVVANLKETQLAEIKPGQKVEVEVDTYDGTLTGHVDSIAAGTGSRFSLLPAENATGNFIKVTQRVPVKIKIDDRGGRELRAGMSAEVVIHTR